MKTQTKKTLLQTILSAAIAVVLGTSATSVLAANGPADYFTVANPGGGSYDMLGNYWATTENGTPGPWVSSSQMTFGTNDADANYPPGTAFSLDLDSGNHWNGLVVNTTNLTVSFTGTANTYLDASPMTWWVTNNATVIDNDTRQQFDSGATIKGINWNKKSVDFGGGGTINFQTPMGCNSPAPNTNDGVTINFQMTAPGSAGGTYTGGFVQNAGALNFASAGSAYQFYGFTAGNNFAINGGTIDNTSGSAMTLSFAGGGGISIGGDFTFVGSANLDLGTASVALAASPMITVNANTLAMGGSLNDGGSGYGITKAGNGTLAFNGTSNVFSGPLVVNGGALVFGSLPTNAASVTVASGAALDVSAACPVTLAASQTLSVTNAALTVGYSSLATAITTPVLAVGGTTNVIDVASLPIGVTFPLQVEVIRYTTMSGTFNFGLGTMPEAGFTADISNNVANGSVDLVILSGPVVRNLTWSGSVNGKWDTTTTNWLYQAASTTYNPGDFVRFDDSATGQTNISLTTALSPGGLIVSNETHTYNLGNGNTGGGYISGPISLEKDGSGLLILDDGGNDFSGGLNINAGTVQVGNHDSLGYLGSGPVTDNGALVFNQSANDGSLTNSISGTGTVTQEGGDTLQLAGANTFTGNVLVNNNSTLQLGSAGALGGNPAVTVTSGSTLDLNGSSVGTNVVTVSGSGVGGNGAIVNTGAEQDHALQFVTLTGNTTFGGGGRWDIRYGSVSAVLSTGGNAYNLTKTGANQVSLVSAAVDPALGNVDVQQGSLALQEDTSGLGNPADTLTVESGASLEFYKLTNELNKVIVLNGFGGISYSISNDAGANVIMGPVTLNTACSILVNGTSLALNGNLTGGQLTKDGSGALIINGNASNAGITADTGELILSGTANGPITCNSIIPAAFAGTGTNFGTTELAGDFYPGDTNVPGTITLDGLTLDSGAIVYFDLGATNTVGGGVNDLIQVNGNLTLNGNSVVINPIGLLQDGASYRLANYTGTLTGSLSVSGPEGYAFAVDTSTPGQINIVPSGGPPVWTGGSTIDSFWSDTANWGGISIASGKPLYFTGNNRLVNTNDTPAGTSYGDIGFNAGAGAFVLNGNPVVMGGNINSFSTNVQTINLSLSFSGNPTINGGSGGVIIAGNSSNTLASGTETLTLAGKGGLADSITSAGSQLTLLTTPTADWTLLDNASNVPVLTPATLNVYNGGFFTFGASNSAPTVTLEGSDGTSSQRSVIGNDTGTSVMNMRNGSLTIQTRFNVGNGTAGAALNVSGGTINVEDGHGVSIADNKATTVGAINVSGGTLNCGPVTNGAAHSFFVATRGTGTLTVSGTGAVNCSTLDVSRNASSTGSAGTVNLNGGILTAGRVSTGTSATGSGGSPTATFNFNGGTLAAAGSSTTWFQGRLSSPAIPITAIVKSGGAIFDSSSNSVSVLEPLLHDSALGSTNDGGLIKLGSGTLTLGAANNYTGPTIVSNGTLEVDGSLAASVVTVESGATLSGTGSVGDSITVNGGGAIAPGGVGTVGTLTASGNIVLNGTTVMEVNKSAALRDLLTTSGSITYGGTLSVTNLGGTLAGGDSFQLFSATGGYSGSFTNITPASPGAGLAWDTSALDSQGILKVKSTVVVHPTIGGLSVSGGKVIFTVTGGNASTTLYVLTSTNLDVPLANWMPVTTNQFDSNGNFNFTNAVSGSPQQFYIIQEQ